VSNVLVDWGQFSRNVSRHQQGSDT